MKRLGGLGAGADEDNARRYPLFVGLILSPHGGGRGRGDVVAQLIDDNQVSSSWLKNIKRTGKRNNKQCICNVATFPSHASDAGSHEVIPTKGELVQSSSLVSNEKLLTLHFRHFIL